VSPAPSFSLTTKCGVGLGGRVCVWLTLELVEAVLDELVAVEVVAELLEVLEVDAEVVAGADVEVLSDEDAAAAAVDLELEWLPDPHAASSSAGASAKPIRFTIGAA
jgi:hypothetical protein